MQSKKQYTPKLFYRRCLEDLVPNDHIVRKLENALDLSFLYNLTREYYSHEGKPSIDPIVLFKLHIICYFFNFQSERWLFKELQVNLAYRWYIGYDLDEQIPDHSIMTKARRRFPCDIFKQIFEKIIEQCREKDLISGKYLFFDSSLVKANASKESFKTKLKEIDKYLIELDKNNNITNNCNKENETTKEIKFKGKVFNGNLDLKLMGRRRKRNKKNDNMKSTTDKDAEIISRLGKGTFLAYKAHLCVDKKNRIITSIEGSKASVDDLSKIHDLYRKTYERIQRKPDIVIADSHYGGIEGLKYFQDLNIQTCIYPRTSEKNNGKFSNKDFKIFKNGEQIICPADQISSCKKTHGFRIIYTMQKKKCLSCHLKEKCTTSKKSGRRISYYKGNYFENAKLLVNSKWGQKLLRARQLIVEGFIGEAKTSHQLSKCKYKGLNNFQLQLYLIASVINLKRILNANRRINVNKQIMELPSASNKLVKYYLCYIVSVNFYPCYCYNN